MVRIVQTLQSQYNYCPKVSLQCIAAHCASIGWDGHMTSAATVRYLPKSMQHAFDASNCATGTLSHFSPEGT
jgi:hypothetical protein